MTTSTQENPRLDILTKDDVEVAKIHALTDPEIADLLIIAPQQADLPRAKAVLNLQYEKPARMEAIAQNALDRPENGLSSNAERTAILIGILASACRRQDTAAKCSKAKHFLDHAKNFLPAVSKFTSDGWAERIRGFLGHERMQILAPLGRDSEIAAFHFRKAERYRKAGDLQKAAFEEEQGAMRAFNAAIIYRRGLTAVSEARNRLWDAIEMVGNLFIDPVAKELIQAMLDGVRADWLADALVVDYQSLLEDIGDRLKNNDHLRTAFQYSLAVVSAGVAVENSADDPVIGQWALNTARSIVSNASIGRTWRSEAALVIAELCLACNAREEAKYWCGEVIAMDFRGVAYVMAEDLLAQIG